MILSVLNLPGPAGTAQAKRTDGRQDGVWTATKLWADNKLLYDAEVGDVWPGHRGNEIVVGGESNWTTMIYGHEDSWHAVRLFQEAWYVTNIAIGDVDPDHPGNEIVNVGWHGNISMVYWDNASAAWKHVELVNGLKAHLEWGYGVAIGDFDPRYPGNEVATTDDRGQLTIVRKNGADWTYEVAWKDGGPNITYPYLDTVMLADVDASHPGKEILVTGGSKYITEIFFNTTANNWTVKRLWRDRAAPIQLAVGNFDPRYPGNEIAAVGLDKNLTVLHWNGTGWQPEKVYQDSDVIYDAEVAEIQPGRGQEVVMGGWSAKVTTHRRAPGATGWDSRTVFTDDNFVMGVTVGEFDDLHSTNETVVIDRAGVVTKVQYETPDFVLYSPTPENGAVPGASAAFDIMAYSRAGYHEPVTLSVEGLPQGWGASFSPPWVTPTGKSLLTVKVAADEIEHTVMMTVKGVSVSGNKTHTIDIWVDVLPPDEKDFGLMVLPGSQSVVADNWARYTIALYQVNQFSDPVALSIEGLPDGASASFTSKTLTPPGSAILTVWTVTSTPKGPHYLTITGRGGGKEHSSTVVLTVKDASSPDFSIAVAPSTVTMVGSQPLNITVTLVSIYGFSGNVTLSVPGLMKGFHAAFSPPHFVPSGTCVMNLTIDASVQADTYYIEVHGYSGDLDHSAILRVDLDTAGTPDFSLKATPDGANITATFTAYYNITVLPVKGFAGAVALSVQDMPADTSAKFYPPAIAPGQTSRLEVKTVLTTPPGQYHLVIMGKGSGLERTVYLSLNVEKARAHLRILRIDGVPSNAKTDQKIKAQVWVENTGLINATGCKLNFYVDGRIESVKDFRVDVNGVTEVDVTWKAVDGRHNLTYESTSTTPASIENGKVSRTVSVSGPFTAVGGPWVALLIVLLVVIVVAVALGFILGKKGRRKTVKDTGPKRGQPQKKKAARSRKAPA
jgi:hypothetical protein